MENFIGNSKETHFFTVGPKITEKFLLRVQAKNTIIASNKS
jgi:hypothetical protein